MCSHKLDIKKTCSDAQLVFSCQLFTSIWSRILLQELMQCHTHTCWSFLVTPLKLPITNELKKQHLPSMKYFNILLETWSAYCIMHRSNTCLATHGINAKPCLHRNYFTSMGWPKTQQFRLDLYPINGHPLKAEICSIISSWGGKSSTVLPHFLYRSKPLYLQSHKPSTTLVTSLANLCWHKTCSSKNYLLSRNY